ncbi:MAG: flagellar basal body L-ring protein, partial [Gammaproteobacteria bacterium]|nr:flagellar basal body L-ring protein [Gammaproteobacteria bacterium]
MATRLIVVGVLCAALGACSLRPPERGAWRGPALPADPPPDVAPTGSIWRDGGDVPLFENAVARNAGDILTIR